MPGSVDSRAGKRRRSMSFRLPVAMATTHPFTSGAGYRRPPSFPIGARKVAPLVAVPAASDGAADAQEMRWPNHSR